MTKVEQTWSAEAFDAVGIRARDGKFTIQGIDGDQVKLEGDFEERLFRNLRPGPVGRWLQIYSSGHIGDTQFTLQLPKYKAWVVDLFSGRAQFKADNIQARLHLMLGKGEIQVENCRGVFSAASGNANILLKHFIEAEMPEMPSLPKEERQVKQEEPESWPDWWEDFWTQMGGEFGEKFLRRFFGQARAGGQNPGVNLQIGKGDLQLEDIEAGACIVRSARGDAKLKRGRVANLDMNIIRGDIECESCMPAGDWAIRVNHGDIRLSLPSDAGARLDVATRHGDIQSNTPLVRVTRQGPEAWHGGRMVGTMGASIEGKVPEIHVSTLRGDIKIETQPTASQHHEKSEAGKVLSPPPVAKSADSYATQLAVLTALSEGRISVDEAERLLRGLNS